jgi:hypothetical protein
VRVSSYGKKSLKAEGRSFRVDIYQVKTAFQNSANVLPLKKFYYSIYHGEKEADASLGI